MQKTEFQQLISQGIPSTLPPKNKYDQTRNHAPIRKQILDNKEKKLALKNALRYFPESFHSELAPEFKSELEAFGRIYMYRFKPAYKIYA